MPEFRDISLSRALRNVGGGVVAGRVPVYTGTNNDTTQSTSAPMFEDSLVITQIQSDIDALETGVGLINSSPAGTVKGRIVGVGAGVPQDLTPAQLRTLINVNDGATVGATWGTNLTNIPTLVNAFAALTPTAGQIPYFSSSSAIALISSSADARNLLSAANYAAMREQLELVVGTNVQAQNANLNSLSGLTLVANNVIYSTGANTLAQSPLTSFARSILDDTTAAEVRTTLEIPDRIITLSEEDEDDNPIDPNDEELAGPLIYVPGSSPTARPVPTVPMVPASQSQYWNGTAGLIYAEPAGMALSKQVNYIGTRSGTFIVEGSNGFSQRMTISDDISINSMSGCIDGQEYSMRIIAGSGGPHNVAFGGNTQPPSNLPNEVSPSLLSLDTGDTLIFKMLTYLDETQTTRFIEIYGVELREPPALLAPVITTGSISPLSSATPVAFTATTNTIGNPNPTLTYQGRLNGFNVSGATTNPWTPPSDGFVEIVVTATNTQGSDVETYSGRIGRAQPVILGYDFKIKTTTGNGTENFPLTGGHFSSAPIAGDEAIYIECTASTSTSAPTAPATGFVRVGTSINNTTGDTQPLRLTVWRKTLTSDDITAGTLSGVRIGGFASGEMMIVRGLGQIDFDSTSTSSSTETSDTVAMHTATSSHPALAVEIIFSTAFDTKAGVGTLSNSTYVGHTTTLFGNTSTSRVGHRVFTRRVSSGVNPGGTWTGTGSANARIKSTVLFLIGPDG